MPGSVATNFPRGIEEVVDWSTALLTYLRQHGYHHIEASADAEQQWFDHVKETYGWTLIGKAKSWFTGYNSNVPGHEEGFWVGPTVLDHVTPQMDVYTEEIFGPVLSVVRADTVDEAIALINANPYGNGTAIFTNSGAAARQFQRGVHVGMIGINVPIPVPMAYYSFGGWKDSLFGDKHVHGPEGVSFYTRGKVITSRWPKVEAPSGASYHFPTNG